ncbi:condensation domain-containing protein [Amycolatopsis acidiphila]|uniref:AMP-binding protein n=1 Tax=Amycolatopsis acidiphila TaxID=715473 RepID=A0A557ZX75_9PSEU|nr:condensation domain-containing protein [Amycolatopsis acidiphila]TVT16604.1 AMP-binding protein [Amycolatopsis acidiphila]UIJ62052.1 condensation domain-containing protein [Amycolatopsis acidiphila]GHG98944.1 hypothetical protein GCM10017788_79320 [Amycolatopsis acidiphila]
MRDGDRSAEGVKVLDSRLRPVRAGEVGEIYLGEPGLAEGYLGQPALTATRFVADPGAQGGRMYRTGDLAVVDEEGRLYFRGRADDQVKVRGHRIELGEVEAVLRSASGVGRAVVVARAVPPGAARRDLCAYAVPEPGRTIEQAALVAWLREHLPGPMVPRYVCVLDRLPTTVNGKLDRAALPLPGRRAGCEAPETDAERQVVDAMTAVLEDDEVDVTDDFFAVGGDSVRVVRLLALLRAAGWVVGQADVFAARTARALAARITRADGAATEAGAWYEPDSAIREDVEQRFGPGSTVLPVSPMQFGMVFHTLLAPEQGMYQVQLVWDLDGPLDSGRLRTAWAKLLDRHPHLRAAFTIAGARGDVVAVVPPSISPKWTWIDVEGAGEPGRWMAEVLRTEWQGSLNPADAPLVRLAVVRSGPARHRLVVTAHHALLDGWSEPILLRDLLRLYVAGETPVPPAPGYEDYLRWLHEQDAAAALRAWTAELSGGKPNLVAGEPPRRAGAGTLTGVDVCCAPETAEALRERAVEAGVTLNALIQAGWGLALRRLTGSDDVVFGTTTSGRDAAVPGIDEIVGLCINTVPVRVRAAEGDRVVTLARQAQAHQVKFAPHAHLGLGRLQEELGVPALFDTVVVFQSYPRRAGEIAAAAACAGLSVAGFQSSSTGNYPLVFRVDVDPAVTMSVQYDHTRFPAEEAAATARFLEQVFEALAANPDTAVGAVMERGVFPARVDAQPVSRPEPAEQETEMERALAGIFADVLGRDVLGADESFFAMGGNSLKATRLVGRVRSVLGLELSVRDVFEKATVRGLAACLRVSDVDGEPAGVAARPVLRKRVGG